MSENGYFMYLCRKVGLDKVYEDEYGYLNLANVLNSVPFEVIVPMDINRAIDAEQERKRYVNETGDYTSIDDSKPVSILEVFTAFCERIPDNAPETSGTATDWFFRMIYNLNIDIPDEHWNDASAAYIENQLDIFNKRKYRGNGYGGAFPLRNPRGDQRKVELWYQMQSYLVENYI